MMLELWKDGKKFSGYDKNLVRTPSIQTRGGLFWGSESEKATPKRLQKADFVFKKVTDLTRYTPTTYGKSHIVTLLFSVGYDS